MSNITKLNTNDYKLGGNICKKVYDNLITLINNGLLNVKELCQNGDNLIIQEAKKNNINVKKESILIAMPTCISLNNCTGYYRYEKQMDNYNQIKKGDVVKIELGVNINGCINLFGDTFIYNEKDNEKKNEKDNRYDKYLSLLNKLEKSTLKLLKPQKLNDDIRMKIESLCTEQDCFPLENTVSYQAFENLLKSQDSKSIVLNYTPYYDDEDSLIVEPNICYEFEENEIYHINLTFIIDNLQIDNKTDHLLKELHESHIYNYNDYYYGLKHKSSKEFYQNIKSLHKNNAFDVNKYKENVKNRIGIKESYENGILDKYSIYYSKDNLPIFHRKFTAIVTKDGGFKLE